MMAAAWSQLTTLPLPHFGELMMTDGSLHHSSLPPSVLDQKQNPLVARLLQNVSFFSPYTPQGSLFVGKKGLVLRQQKVELTLQQDQDQVRLVPRHPQIQADALKLQQNRCR